METRQLPSGTVTLLFTDIEGSTRLLEELGREAYVRALTEHRRLLREAFTSHGGVEVEMQGDSFHFAFPFARDAVAAAAAGHQALRDHEWESQPIRVRIGLHTGEPMQADGLYAGIDVHRAARVMGAAHGGQTLLSEHTAQLVAGEGFPLVALGEHRLKDLSEPTRLYQFGAGEFPPLKTLRRTNLPLQPTPLIGRVHERAEVRGLLEANRLVTLSGPGGCGKTRLAVQVAADVAERFPDGVFWVALGPIPSHQLVLPAIARALGVREAPGVALELTLGQAIGDSSMLVLLDNFEHVLDARTAIGELLRSCGGVHVLVTSRAALQLSAEHVYDVPSLRDEEAVDLFAQRARQIDSAFVADETVPMICRRLDGLPLSIELAAARVRVLEPRALLERLEHRLTLLTGGAADLPPRQRTLRATIEWSHELLDEDERRVFRRLAVFAGSFTLDAADGVAGADLNTAEALVAKSLVRHSGERLMLLETLREFAAEELEAAHETEVLRDRHARYYLELAERLAPALRGGEGRVRSLRQLAVELDNIRAALDHFDATGRVAETLRLGIALWRFWMARGYAGAGRRWLERGLGSTGEIAPTLRAQALEGLAIFAHFMGDLGEAQAFAEQSLELYSRLDDPRGVAESVNNLGVIALAAGDIGAAETFFEESAALAEAYGDRHLEFITSQNRASIALERHEFERAASLAAANRETVELSGDIGLAAMSGSTEGSALRKLGRAADAEVAFRRCLVAAEALPQREHAVLALLGLAELAVAAGDYERSARLTGAADATVQAMGISWAGFSDFDRGMREELADLLSEAPPDGTVAAAYAEGHQLTFEEAVAVALEEGVAPVRDPARAR